jgi:hypothetical protein
MDEENARQVRDAITQLTERISEIDKKLAEQYNDRPSRSSERSSTIQIDTHSIVRLGERIGFMEEKIKDVKDEVGKLIDALDKYQEKATTLYVTKADFEPIRKLVYGAVGLILVTVLSAFMLLVVKSNTSTTEYRVLDSKPVVTQQGTK